MLKFNKKILRILSAATLGLAAVIVLFYTIENYRGAKAWERTKTEFEQQGISFDFATLVPPPVADNENFAATPLLAALFDYTTEEGDGPFGPPFNNRIIYSHNDGVKRLNAIRRGYLTGQNLPPVSWQRQRHTDLAAWADYYRTNKDFPHAAAHASATEAVLTALGKYDPDLDQLRSASAQPKCRFPLHYDETPLAALHIPHLSPGMSLAQVLALHASAELEAGHHDKALNDLNVIWKFQEGLKQEPLLISQLVNVTMGQLSIQPVWEGIARSQWSDSELSAIQKHYASMNILQGQNLAIRGEAVGLAVQTLDWFKTKNLRARRQFWGLFIFYSSDPYQSGGWPVLFSTFPNGWIDQGKTAMAHFYLADYLPCIDPARHRVSVDRIAATSDKIQNLSLYDPYNFFVKLTASSVTASAIKFAQVQVMTDQVVIAGALERYKHKYGKYPEQLKVLAPEFLAIVPCDIIDGKPMRYQPGINSRYKLYSIGWNQKDDAGMIAFQKGNPDRIDENQGDWVWAYPKN